MNIWLDAQLSPALAPWLASNFSMVVVPIRELGLRDAVDFAIFEAAKSSQAIVMTKDADFAELVTRLGAPPQVIWVRCGNTTNVALQDLLQREMPSVLMRLLQGDQLVEIGITD